MDDFGTRLKRARIARNMNQKALAHRCGLSPSWISHFEVGSRRPSFDVLMKLIDGLRVCPRYLMDTRATWTPGGRRGK